MERDSWMFTLLLDAARCALGAAVGAVVFYFTDLMLESHESTTTTATSEAEKKIKEIAKRSTSEAEKKIQEIAKRSTSKAEMKIQEIAKRSTSKAEMKIQEIAKRLGREIETSSYEELLADDIINPDNIEVGFESIGGLETKKNELHELAILPLQRPKLFSHGNLSAPPKGVLLYGPPGTGKTMLAKAIAKESGAVFINVKMSKLKNHWYGQSEKMGAAVFSLAHKLQPSIIFIDEVDSLLGQRQVTDDERSTNLKNEFMASWDGLTTNPNARVMVLGATNRPALLDEAIHRRFSEAFEIGLPNRKERVDILRGILKGERVEESINFDHIAGLCDGYSGSDLFHLCRKAVKYPIKELLNAEKKSGDKSSSESDPDPEPKPRALLQKDLEKVLMTSIRTSVAAKEYGRLSESSLTYYI